MTVTSNTYHKYTLLVVTLTQIEDQSWHKVQMGCFNISRTTYLNKMKFRGYITSGKRILLVELAFRGRSLAHNKIVQKCYVPLFYKTMGSIFFKVCVCKLSGSVKFKRTISISQGQKCQVECESLKHLLFLFDDFPVRVRKLQHYRTC